MPLETGAPEWWLWKLYGQLEARRGDMEKFDAYYRGDHPLPFITKAHEPKLFTEFRRMLEESRSNFCRLVVDAVEERMQIEGIRLSTKSSRTDRKAWDIWQANQMDSDSNVAMIESLTMGVSYLSVWAGEKYPVIAVEDPRQTIVAYVPGTNYRERAAALKVWTDDWTGRIRANVYLPKGIYKFEQQSGGGGGPVVGPPTRWPGEASAPPPARGSGGVPEARWVELESEFAPNGVGVVPIVPLRNRPRLLCEGESELSDVTSVQNEINGLLFLRQLAAYFSSHRQRWASGIQMIKEDGTPNVTINTAVDQLWWNANPDGKFGDFEQTDLSGYIQSIEQMVGHIAITTRTPRHYLLPEGQEPSGDSVKAAESGLVKKIQRKMRPFGEGFEEALRLARLFSGAGSTPPNSEIVWADPQIRTEAEITDAAIKKLQAGLIDRRQALEDVGYTQTQIERILATTPEPPTVPVQPEEIPA